MLRFFVSLPIEERECRNTHMGGGDYSLRTSALPPLRQTEGISKILIFEMNKNLESKKQSQ